MENQPLPILYHEPKQGIAVICLFHLPTASSYQILFHYNLWVFLIVRFSVSKNANKQGFKLILFCCKCIFPANLPTVLHSVSQWIVKLQYYILIFDLIVALCVLIDWQCMQWLSDRKKIFFQQELIQSKFSCPTQSHLIHIYLQIQY